MLSDGLILLHYNARSHTANILRANLQRFGWETLQHPPYSPDFSPCDFDLFGDQKKDIRGLPLSIRRLVSQWDEYINTYGRYF